MLASNLTVQIPSTQNERGINSDTAVSSPELLYSPQSAIVNQVKRKMHRNDFGYASSAASPLSVSASASASIAESSASAFSGSFLCGCFFSASASFQPFNFS
ncbi:MAG: hypothetical protein R2860_12005 [Desulfobacterales bacterium]